MTFVYQIPSRLLFYKDRGNKTLTINPVLSASDPSAGKYMSTTFTEVGNPLISSIGVMSETSSDDYAQIAYSVKIEGSQDFQVNFKFTTIPNYWVNSWMLADSVTANLFGCYLGAGTVSCYVAGEEVITSSTSYVQGHSYEGYFRRTSNVYSLYLKDVNTGSEIRRSAIRTDSLAYSGTLIIGRTGE